MDNSSKINLISIVVVVGFAVVMTVSRKFSIGRLLSGSAGGVNDSPDESAIISFYTAGNMLANAVRSNLNGMRYSTYIALPSPNSTFVDNASAIMALDLPYNTQVHLLGLSKQHKLDRIQFENFLRTNGMEKVDLEGDFPDYFDIYAAQGQQVQVRELLNPETMGFVVDYCRSHFWEINSSELYIVATDEDKGNENMIQQSLQFVDQIKPALLPGEPGAAAVHHQVPYGEYDGGVLPCPICQKSMAVQEAAWLVCPEGHGVLINGRDILRLRNHELEIPANPTKAVNHGMLTCPNCHNQMTLVDYQDSGVQIDSCEHCPFRWLDAPEITALGSKV